MLDYEKKTKKKKNQTKTYELHKVYIEVWQVQGIVKIMQWRYEDLGLQAEKKN
jgi:hypothetical protein